MPCRPVALLALPLLLAACAVPQRTAPPVLSVDSTLETVLPGIVSTPGTEIRLALSPDGTRMLWGVTAPEGGRGGWDVFESRRRGDVWSAPRPAAFNSSANDFDPSWAPDGRQVLFFSNRDGGLGGDDLYAVPFSAATGQYGAARNLGPAVNTPADEWAPVLAPDGRLLFASDGWGGLGGHDLFLSTPDGTGWGAPQNLGPGVNTAGEDFDAAFLDGGRALVFTSGTFEPFAVALFVAYADGAVWGRREKLGLPVNADPFSTLGPSTSAAAPGVLFVSTQRGGAPGGFDVFRIAYRLR